MVTMLRRTMSSLGAFAAFLMAAGAAPAALPAPVARPEALAHGSALARPRGGASYTAVPLGHSLEDRSEPAIRARTDVR